MGFFRQNASRAEKKYMLCAGGLMLLALYGVFSNIVTAGWVDAAAISLAIPVSLAVFLPYFLDDEANTLRELGPVKRFFAYSFFLLLIYLLCWAALGRGVPGLYTGAFGGDRAGEYKVLYRTTGRRSGECGHKLTLQRLDSQWQGGVCIMEEQWRKLKEGEVVTANERHTRAGSVITKVWKRDAPQDPGKR